MNGELMRLRGVDFAYHPERPVLRGCDLSIAPGERIALTGPNGSGKTTILSLVVGLVHPTAGQVEVFGSPRVRERDFHEVRGRAGLLFQDSDDQLFCPTVAEDVAFGPLNRGKTQAEAAAIVARTLDWLGLSGYESRITYQLSGGEKRLVALATVLAMEPDLLLLDEPTAGLDEATLDRVTGILAGLPQAMLLVSHDRALVDRLATRIVRLADGRVQSV